MSSITKKAIMATLFLSFIIYTSFVYTTGTANDAGENMITEQSKNGKLLFQKYNCVACHQLYGLGGYMGPDLTNVISTQGKGPMYAKAFLKSGTQRMPDFHLNETEIDELVAYLAYVDKTGVSPVKRFKINYNGTVAQN